MARHFNITGELTQELLAPGDSARVSSISLTNVDSTGTTVDAVVDLYIEKKEAGKFYLLKGVNIPTGVTLESSIKGFSNKTNEFGLYIKLTKGTTFTLKAVNPGDGSQGINPPVTVVFVPVGFIP